MTDKEKASQIIDARKALDEHLTAEIKAGNKDVIMPLMAAMMGCSVITWEGGA